MMPFLNLNTALDKIKQFSMFKTHEISIGPVFRLILGTLGIFGIVTGLFLLVRECRFAFQGEWLRLISALILLMIPGLHAFCAARFEGDFQSVRIE
jgi:hypothetical protein